ncbi:glycoside hydrolase family 66 protein [Tepidibacillus infernus]|uniref:CBM6 domain-containing protein n=1 Tax=Tepidibacillus decaturensis TaxID=1413211 RepID=A0A135L214_9BACI|nr:glycoside hydrolase family 66 protein [Tepidibacillus decaturensis]KXG42990.1 hypothetical protein U473_02330 [Tepidibacillus decaturensis]
MKKSLHSFISLFLILVLLFSIALTSEMIQKAHAATDGIIDRVYTNQSRYSPGEIVTINVEMTNDSGTAFNDNVYLTIYHLENQVYTSSQLISLPQESSTTVTFQWTSPLNDFQGYFVYVTAGSSSGATAIDVSSDWTKYPRYGYISEFSPNETLHQSQEKINTLAQDYHINAWQFYDWMYRHDKFIKRTNGQIEPTWLDLFDREISWDTIQNQIGAVHDVNGKAMAYAMGYASREDYTQYGIDPAWGIYEDSSATNQYDVDFNSGKYLYLFDPQNANWQNYIIPEYLDAVNTAGFDGIHVDQMGQRDNVYDYYGNLIDLSTRFSPFLDEAKASLTSNNSNKDQITFNIVDGTVDGWAANDIAQHADVDFLYSEIWFKSNNYIDLKNYIEQIRLLSGNKAVVLAAYMNYEENIGPRYEAEDAVLTNVAVDTDHTGYTGSGFVDQFAENGDKVKFTIDAVEDGEYALVFRFGNSTGGTSTRSIYIDGVKQDTLYFANQANWDTWAHDTYYTANLTQGTHTVTLAYDSSDTGAINLDSLTLGTFDKHSVLLADAAFAASGATHIELGENNRMLAHEYYPNTSKAIRNDLKQGLKNHYNFITAYENLLFDQDVIANDSGNQFIQIQGETVSGDGSGNTLWAIQKRNNDYNIFHLINLTQNDSEWRNSGSAPVEKSNLTTKVYIGTDETISNVYVASPDINFGKTQELAFTTGSDSNGKYVSFTVPSLKYWDMIYMKRSFHVPANDTYEAETAILSNVAVDTDHTGYTGSGFVDQFAEVNDGISFVVKATADDDYVLSFRYGNGGSDAARDVFVDGHYAGTVQFNHTGSWDDWGIGELTVNLSKGYHTIVLWYSATNVGAINLDSLDLDKTYIWQFDRQITSAPAGYRITYRVGLPGWVHWGVNNWQNVQDTAFVTNGSTNDNLDYEISIGPFTSGTTVDFTFLWDDNNNGIPEYDVDRWEGEDFHLNIQ